MKKIEVVENTLREARKPLRAREIEERVGCNFNTVRGALVRLRIAGKVEKAGMFLYKSVP